MLALVPRPVNAVLLLFPIEETGEAFRKREDERIAKEGQPKVDDTIFWVKQKVCEVCFDLNRFQIFQISNACGTIGLIHAIANVLPFNFSLLPIIYYNL